MVSKNRKKKKAKKNSQKQSAPSPRTTGEVSESKAAIAANVAWMLSLISTLIAEAVGVGSGLGQVTMMARNTFNASLVFFTMTLIGLTGFAFDQALRYVQRKVLWWVGPSSVGGL